MKPALSIAAAAFALLGCAASAPTSAEAACTTSTPKDDIEAAEAQKLYDCIKGDMIKGYQKGNKGWIPANIFADYRTWKLANTAPAAPGFHGERFLVTYVNDTGYDEYTKFAEEGVAMPVGSWMAKESFTVTSKGKVRSGPLFLMQKVEKGSSPETGDWYYMMVAPNGRPQAVNVVSACADCHLGNFGDRDSLGYPVEDVRVSN